MSHAEHLQILQDQKDKSKLPPNRVPSTMLYGFVNNEVVGRFNIRHELNQNLLSEVVTSDIQLVLATERTVMPHRCFGKD
jgi:predicted acetyltransferase